MILPAPRFIVFYNGTREKEDSILRLSDSFPEGAREKSDVEVTVRMININYGHNKELLEKCKTLNEYSWFVAKVREYSKSLSIDEAVDKAIDEMPEDAELKRFLEEHRAEVKDMCLTEYDEKEHMDAVRAEGREEINTLHGILLEEGRIEDLKRAINDKEFQEKLLEEYNI